MRVRKSEVKVVRDAEAAESGGGRFDEILKAVEHDIVLGKMKPGQRVDERELAKRFGTSRTPIREVLAKMSSLGIIELRRNRGAFVAELSSSRLIGMLEVMTELKVLAAKQATRRMSAGERASLDRIRGQMAACVEKKDLQRYFDKAVALHDAICAGAHNEFLLENTRKIQVCLCVYRQHLSRILHMPIQTSFEENSHIVDAILNGDAADAERWMRKQTDLRMEEFADLIALVSGSVSATLGNAA